MASPKGANLLYRVFFKNNLRNRVCFETNCNGGLIFTLIPPFLLAASMYRHCHQRYTCVPPLPKAEPKLTHLVSQFVLAEPKLTHVSPFVLAGHANVGSPAIGTCRTRRGCFLQRFSLKKKWV